MSRRLVVAIAFTALGLLPRFAVIVSAQELPSPVSTDVSFAVVSSPISSLRLADLQQFPLPAPRPKSGGLSLLGSLYASTAVMQGLDIHSTMKALDRGAVEANPMMSGVTKNKAVFIGVKAGVAAGTILAARQLAKRNKVAAIVTLVAINSAYAYVVQHNYKIARKLQ